MDVSNYQWILLGQARHAGQTRLNPRQRNQGSPECEPAAENKLDWDKPLRVTRTDGLGVGGVGASKPKATGEVYQLNRVTDLKVSMDRFVSAGHWRSGCSAS
jgi:hypothetical protein